HFEINFRIDAGGRGVPVTKQVSDLLQRDSLGQQSGGKCVTQAVRAASAARYSSSSDSSPPDRPQRAVDRPIRWVERQKQIAARRRARAYLLHVLQNGFAHLVL